MFEIGRRVKTSDSNYATRGRSGKIVAVGVSGFDWDVMLDGAFRYLMNENELDLIPVINLINEDGELVKNMTNVPQDVEKYLYDHPGQVIFSDYSGYTAWFTDEVCGQNQEIIRVLTMTEEQMKLYSEG